MKTLTKQTPTVFIPYQNDSLLIRVADKTEFDDVYRLAHDCYVAKGYALPRPNYLLIHYPHFDYLEETTIWIAIFKNEIVGSISVTRDSKYGFTIDEDFKAECDLVRAEGRKAGAAWRLVVKPACRDGGTIVKSLIETAIGAFLSQGGDTFLLEVNPAHERVYERMLNMKVLSRQRSAAGLKEAPAILMCGMFETMPPRWKAKFRYMSRLKQSFKMAS